MHAEAHLLLPAMPTLRIFLSCAVLWFVASKVNGLHAHGSRIGALSTAARWLTGTGAVAAVIWTVWS